MEFLLKLNSGKKAAWNEVQSEDPITQCFKDLRSRMAPGVTQLGRCEFQGVQIFTLMPSKRFDLDP